MRLLLFMAFVVFSVALSAQNSDCETAVSVCNNVYQETDSPSGTGNVFEMAPGTCQTGGEFNSAWYVFTPQSSGAFGFVLQPNNNFDDYDWSLFNISDNGCAGINSGLSPEVSCNSYGALSGVQGPTGISSANGGSGNANGPGDTFGPPFNGDLQVQVGEVYALVVMNYSATLNGYTLDFSNSQVPVFDQQPPSIASVDVHCNHDLIEFFFSESVQVTGLTSGNLILTCNGVDAVVGSLTLSGEDFANVISVPISGWTNVSGDATLTFVQPVADACGNVYSGPFTFQVPAIPQWSFAPTAACEGVGGAISVSLTNTGLDCYTFSSNGGALSTSNCTSATFSNVPAGNYVITALNTTSNCQFQGNVTVGNVDLSVDAGDDVTLCDLQTTLEGTSSAGFVMWTAPPGVFFTNNGSLTSAVNVIEAGVYTLTLQVSQGSCSVQDEVNITFQNPPNIQLQVEDAVCYDDCDGRLNVSFEAGEISATVGGTTLTGSDVWFEDLCRGDVNVFVNFGEGCNATYEATIGSLPELTAEIMATPYIQELINPVFELKAAVSGTDSVQWSIPSMGMTYDELIWPLTMPAVPGAYDVLLTLLGDSGCTAVERTTIYIKDEFLIFVPSAFTPDNDGVNDFFQPNVTFTPPFFRMMIFDRWGVKIFESNDPSERWLGQGLDGTHYANNDVYTWQITVQLDDSEAKVYTGTVTLMR